MPRKSKIEQPAKAVETAQENIPVIVTVGREHCLTPHSIELRKKDGIVVDARTEDQRHIETIGAKTIEQIFREVGYDIPADDKTRLEIVISPHNGEIVAIQPQSKQAPAEDKTEESSDESGEEESSAAGDEETASGDGDEETGDGDEETGDGDNKTE